jgi:hypothetical protein
VMAGGLWHRFRTCLSCGVGISLAGSLNTTIFHFSLFTFPYFLFFNIDFYIILKFYEKVAPSNLNCPGIAQAAQAVLRSG